MATVLGIHGGYSINQHDASATLIQDGRVIMAIEEERHYRQKSAFGLLPVTSIKQILSDLNMRIEEIDEIVLPGETYPFAKERARKWIKHHFGEAKKLTTQNHQTAHIGTAFWHSGFKRALCISFDYSGDGISTCIGIGDAYDGISILEVFPNTNSLGQFYATITSFLGFKPGEDEYKVMGLASYGNAGEDLDFFLKPNSNGYFVEQSFTRGSTPATQFEPYYSEKLVEKLGPPRRQGEPITDRHIRIAKGAQIALEQAIFSLVKFSLNKLSIDDLARRKLCLSGGVALNCSANGKLLKEFHKIEEIFVAPASSDRGLSLGCAYLGAHVNSDKINKLQNHFLGSTSSITQIDQTLELTGVKKKSLNNPAKTAAELISQGKIIGWFQGRSEFGPRALGNRSILANASDPKMKNLVNQKIKFREEFRPFAPAVMQEFSEKYFDLNFASPYMTFAVNAFNKTKIELPSVVHVDSTSRVQTVSETENPLFYSVLKYLNELIGHPVVLNTSFNIKGQPIVETPFDAIATFYATGMDYLILGNWLVIK